MLMNNTICFALLADAKPGHFHLALGLGRIQVLALVHPHPPRGGPLDLLLSSLHRSKTAATSRPAAAGRQCYGGRRAPGGAAGGSGRRVVAPTLCDGRRGTVVAGGRRTARQLAPRLGRRRLSASLQFHEKLVNESTREKGMRSVRRWALMGLSPMLG